MILIMLLAVPVYFFISSFSSITQELNRASQRMGIPATLRLSPLFIFLPCFILHTTAHDASREALEFTDGVSGGIPDGVSGVIPDGVSGVIPPSPSKQVLVFADQRLAAVYPVIQKFKATITSDPLGITKTWVGSDICSYKGFYCDNPPDNKSAITVAAVDFNGLRLSAPSLDGFLDQLPDIALFHGNSNNFSGALSPNIAKLRYLYELDISNNQFSGKFPTAVLGMNGLQFLDIRFNFFEGSVPAQIFTQNLYALFINNNGFMMQLPENISTTRLLYLTLANNKFNGALPKTIFKALSSLTEVLLINDQLTGCLPYEIGYLKEAVVFDAETNNLTGPLPFSLACLQKVEQLNFARNLLFGMVPEVVCGLPNLANLSLSDNYFNLVGPLCRVLIERGVLDVRNNCIPGLPFQRPIHECAEFFAYPRLCPRFWSYVYIPCKPYFVSAMDPYPSPSPSPFPSP